MGVRSARRGLGDTIHDQCDRRWDGDAADLEASLGDGDAIEGRAVWLPDAQSGSGYDLHGSWGDYGLAGGGGVRADGGSVKDGCRGRVGRGISWLAFSIPIPVSTLSLFWETYETMDDVELSEGRC